MKSTLKKILSKKTIDFLIKIKNIFRYPFLNEHEKSVLKWIYRNYDKKRFNYRLGNGIVFDVGGYKGDYTAELLKTNPDITSYIFEPVSEFANNLKTRFNNTPKVKVFNIGLSNITKQLEISLDDDGSSFHKKSLSNKKEYAQIIDFKDFVDENKIAHIALLKLNIEGAEYDLLERIINSNCINKIDHVLVQFHDIDEYSTQRMHKLQEMLSRTHQLSWAIRPFVWESWQKK